MKHKILNGTIGDEYFVIAIFDNKEGVFPMKVGLQRFFKEYESVELKEKRKKELDHGYMTLSDSGNSSGCRRK